MKVTKLILIVSICIFAYSANAKTTYFKNVEKRFPKLINMYKRLEDIKQPDFKQYKESGVSLLKIVNNNINKMEHIEEMPGKDYWQTGAETIQKGGGDCEDFAIIKWQTLLANGINEKDMYFMEGFEKAGIYHFILVVILDNHVYYLDNESNDIISSPIPKTSVTFNRFGYYVYNPYQ